MIEKIIIDNFKLYKQNINIPLNKLNLFTGINGKGKSSVLQVLLLMSQSVQMNRMTNKIFLNGGSVKLGSFDDIKNKETLFSEYIHFGFKLANSEVNYYLHNDNSDASELFIEKINVKVNNNNYELNRTDDWYTIDQISNSQYLLFDLFPNETVKQYIDEIPIIISDNLLTRIHYVSADRIGPRNYYENKSLGHFVNVGALGENTVNVLYKKGNEIINNHILQAYSLMFHEKLEELSKTVEDNVNYWMDKIFQGAKVRVEAIKGEDLLKLRINSDGKSNYYKPTNVGYGFSYSLPIIVAGLIAKPGEVLIIENPEAHLHPCAQSIISKFLSIVASSGVQVIIESHSEHILNGIRIAVKDKYIAQDTTNVLYFGNQENTYFQQINMDEEGGIDNWPRFFFDQATNDLNYLLGI